MPENRDFSHLPLPFLYRGKPKLRGFNSPSERTNRNRNNRAHHGEYLKRRSSELSQFWKERRINRLEEDLPEIQVGIPILLEIEPSSNIEFLRGLGFEIVCEIEDGFIIVASEDIDLTRFNQKANEFIQNISLRCNTPAKVYALCEDSDRLKRILSDDLYSKFLMNIMGCRKRFIRLKLYQKPLKFIIKIILCRLEFTIIPLGVGNHVQ